MAIQSFKIFVKLPMNYHKLFTNIKKILKLDMLDIQYPWTLVYTQINNQIRHKIVAKKGQKWETFHCFVTHFACQYIVNFPTTHT